MLSEHAHRPTQRITQAPGLMSEKQAHSLSLHDVPAHNSPNVLAFNGHRDKFYPSAPALTSSKNPEHCPNCQQEYTLSSASQNHPGDVSENILRRKTPNGTLAAGYDGSLVGQLQHPHTHKHLLIPASRFSQRAPFQRQLSNQQRTKTLPTPIPQTVTQQKHDICHNAAVPSNHIRGALANASHKPRMSTSVGMDSMLNQSPLQGFPINTTPNNSIPTVLQPLWPPCLGPTSLQTPGPVGPYWPNGAFEPYRPAPLCDSRYHVAQQPQLTGFVSQPQPANLFRNRRTSNPEDSEHWEPPYSSQKSKLDGTSIEGWANSNTRSLPHDFSHKLAISHDRPGFDDYSMIKQARSQENETQGPLEGSIRDPEVMYGQAHFKERILQWAYRIYCSLLVSLDTSRRESQHGIQHAAGNSPYSHRLRRPHPSWSSKQCQAIPIATRYKQGEAPMSIDADNAFPMSRPPINETCNALSNGSFQTHAVTRNWTPYIWSEKLNMNYPAPSTLHSSRNCFNVGASYFPSRLAQEQTTGSPMSAAVKAMDILSQLCHESHWQWLDGMLLNGCLAYGLGNYIKATKWYQKVLRQDPENVEAMSNLAATFLSLGRRHEAEQYWMRAVKQRPEYFEAVEHLVGLLHEEHRGKEAVGVIQFIESALRMDPNSGAPEHPQMPSQVANTYAISPSDNGRLLALIHGKGNVLYQSGDNDGAAKAFEDAIIIGTKQYKTGIRGLIDHMLKIFCERRHIIDSSTAEASFTDSPILLSPEVALETASLAFPPNGDLPGLDYVPSSMAQRAAVSLISNSLLSLAKIYQDSMSSSGASAGTPRATSGVKEILALYYLSLSLQPSPSTANNVGILLASVQQPARTDQQTTSLSPHPSSQLTTISGVLPGSGVALALAYYDYGLKLDAKHAHLYTNLGSLFKDIGQLSAAIKMYEKAVDCDGSFDIALANLANAVKDKGNIKDAIHYYKRAVSSNADFAEAVCGLANALNSVCSWIGRGGIFSPYDNLDRWHVDEQGLLYDSKTSCATSRGWMERVIKIVQKQLADGVDWGKGVILTVSIEHLMRQLGQTVQSSKVSLARNALEAWTERCWEGAKVVRLVERATKDLTWRVYRDTYVSEPGMKPVRRERPQLPAVLAAPSAPTVLPFHTFTCPLSAKQIRLISQRNGLRVSCTTLRASWLPPHIYEPPPPPIYHLNVGYISSDFNNHPLAHLMQSVFGLHDPSKVRAMCYATTASDGSVHRKQIERESSVFHDCSTWSTERLVNQVVEDRIHILVNLNGYTRGAKNEVFAARPAPVQMSFMGFAGTLGAEWCDYLLADKIAVPPNTLRAYRRNVDVLDLFEDGNNDDDTEGWVYGENIIFTKDTFFCCDHKQSAPDAHGERLSWQEEQQCRWKMRKELFPDLADDTVILGNFNQLYKVRVS